MSGGLPRAVVIGGGATGCGVARDMSIRGFQVTLVEYRGIGSGTSSRFHGMLQSGARYAVSDGAFAAECMRERKIIEEVAPSVVELTGGLFVSLPEDPEEFSNQFIVGCERADISCEELPVLGAMKLEPRLIKSVQRVFSVPDAMLNPWKLLELLVEDIRYRGGEILTQHQVTGFQIRNDRVTGVFLQGNGGRLLLEAAVGVNATGRWALGVSELAGQQVDMELTKGAIMVFAHRMVNKVINRCRPARSHDILAPSGTVCLFGTTSKVVDSPESNNVYQEETDMLLAGATALVPDISSCRALRVWAGIRPLVRPKGHTGSAPLPRRHQVIDHSSGGAVGFWTVTGGSWTTHRLMAQEVVDSICESLNLSIPCQTSQISLEGDKKPGNWIPAAKYNPIAQHVPEENVLVCECESTTRTEILEFLGRKREASLSQIYRNLRIGFGPCQGSFCGIRVVETLICRDPQLSAREEITQFWLERLKGQLFVAWGTQAQQILLSDLIHREILGLKISR